MEQRTGTGGRIVDLAWVGFRIGDEFGNGPGRNRRVHLHDVGSTGPSRHWGDVAGGIEFEFLIESCVKCMCWIDQEKRVAVWSRIRDRIGRANRCRSRAVLGDERLTEPLR